MTTEEKFKKLASYWEQQTGGYSTGIHKIANENYLKVISMGEEVVPYIIQSFKEGNSSFHWHTALRILTDEDPVWKINKEGIEIYGKAKLMKEAWINWFEKESKWAEK